MYACDYFHRSVETFPGGQLIFINFWPREVCSFKVGLGLYRSDRLANWKLVSKGAERIALRVSRHEDMFEIKI